MRFSIAAVTAFVVAVPTLAGEQLTKIDADARAAMAFAKARANKFTVQAETKPIPFSEAVKIAKREGKPVFVTVCLDCKAVCAKLRPDIITSHETTLEGSSAPRAILMIPSKTSESGWIKLRWDRLPTDAEVKAEVAKHSPRTSWDEAVSALIMSMVALEADTPAPVQWKQVCDANGCRLVPAGFNPLPAGNGPVAVAAPPVTGERVTGGVFRARFPRLAAFRGKVRGVLGLPAPQVRGQFFEALEADIAPAASAPAAAGPEVVGARERRLLRAVLARYGVTQAELDAVAKKVQATGNDSIWAVLVEILLRHGIAALREFLDSWLNK